MKLESKDPVVRGAIAILGLLVLWGWLFSGGPLASLGTPQQQSTTGPQATAPPPGNIAGVALTGCDNSDGKNNVDTVVANVLNASTDWQGNGIVFVDNAGVIIDTATANAGSGLPTYKTLNVICPVPAGVIGTVYAVGSATENGGVAKVSIGQGMTTVKVSVLGSATGNLTKAMYTSNGANTSTPTGTGTGNEDIKESSATAMNQFDTRTGYISFIQANGSSAFGGPGNPDDPDLKDAGILVGVNTANSAVFADGDIPLYQKTGENTNFRSVSCDKFPNEKAKYTLKACYVMKAIGSGSPATLAQVNAVGSEVDIGWTMRASLGNPGASDDPIVWMIPLTFYQDAGASGKIKYGAVDAGQNVQGQLPHRITFDNS